MNPVFPAQKRAEEFSSMVEGSSTSGLHGTGKYADLVPLVGLVTSLRATPAPEPRPEFVSGLRERLMLAAETALAPDTAVQVEARRQPAPRRTGRERRIAVAIGGFAIVSASASMSVAAQSALPGDTLYPLKRALENVHENVLRDADDKGATMLDNASGRLTEVGELSRSGGQDPAVIAQTLQDFSDQAVEASDVLISDYEATGRLSSIAELRTFTASSLEALRRLESVVPVEVRAAVVQAAAVLDAIDRQALTICPACSDLTDAVDKITTAAATDLGPLLELVDPQQKPSSSPSREPGKRSEDKQPTSQGEPYAPPTATPPATEPPATDDTPTPVLPPTSEGGNDDAPSGGSLSSGIRGLGNTDVGKILEQLTGTVDEVLGVGGDEKKTDK